MALTNPNASLNDTINTIKNTVGTPANSYVKPAYTDVNAPQQKSISDLNSTLGTNFTYDRQAIEDIYNKATASAYNTDLQNQINTEKNYYKQMAATQNTALDTIRQQYSQGIASGASKGMQAANTLSTILGSSQASGDNALQLAQNRQALGDKYATQMKTDASNALATSNETQQALAGISHQFYNDDIQKLTAQLSYNQGINADTAGYEANKQTALANLTASIANAGAGVYNNNQSSLAAIQAAIEEALGYKYTADKNYQGTVYAANR